MKRRRCKECGDEVVQSASLLPYKNKPYYCQTCSKRKEEYETEIVEENYE